jgi:hypothetical protein
MFEKEKRIIGNGGACAQDSKNLKWGRGMDISLWLIRELEEKRTGENVIFLSIG